MSKVKKVNCVLIGLISCSLFVTTPSWERWRCGENLEWMKRVKNCFFMVFCMNAVKLHPAHPSPECVFRRSEWNPALYTLKAYYISPYSCRTERAHVAADANKCILCYLIPHIFPVSSISCEIHLVHHKSDFCSNKPEYFIDVALCYSV